MTASSGPWGLIVAVVVTALVVNPLKDWIQERLEPVRSKPSYSADTKRHILERLTAAEGLERFLHTRYVGQKRFSLEGGETLIPVLDNLLQRAGEAGVQELVLGMAHRGRLNVLVNTLGKVPKDLFSEFEGKHDDALLAGDVKYHQGFSSDINTPGGPMHLTLAFIGELALPRARNESVQPGGGAAQRSEASLPPTMPRV